MACESAIERAIIKARKLEKLFSNYDYFDWLIEFTDRHDNFFVIEDALEYYSDLTDNDKKNIKDFYYFFDVLDTYAYRNDIIPKYTKMGIYYNVKHGNNAFNIGIDGIDDSAYGYIEKVDSNEDVISLDMIMEELNNKYKKRVR